MKRPAYHERLIAVLFAIGVAKNEIKGFEIFEKGYNDLKEKYKDELKEYCDTVSEELK